MASLKTIKYRRSTVTTTRQIMKAMNMVATAKFQKTKGRLERARPLFQESKKIIATLQYDENAADNVFIKARPVKNSAYVVITSDRSFCGSYNSNIAAKALAAMTAGKNEKIICVGLKGCDFFSRRQKQVLCHYRQISETALYEDAELIAKQITSLYLSEEVDEVYVAYTQFQSMLSHVPRVEKLLPLSSGPAKYEANPVGYGPDKDTFWQKAIPKYITTYIFGALLESAACEQAARMVNMDSAANNATKIINKLNLSYNRIRQAAITQEISEIVNGANALK